MKFREDRIKQTSHFIEWMTKHSGHRITMSLKDRKGSYLLSCHCEDCDKREAFVFFKGASNS